MSEPISRHPVYEHLKGCANTDSSKAADLDALDLPEEVRERVQDAANKVETAAWSGDAQGAEEMAAESAEEIISDLPEELAGGVDTEGLTANRPDRMAARVRRW